MYRHFQGIFWLGEGLRGGGYVGELSIKEFVMGEENIHEGGVGFLSIFLKSNEKINMKKFLQLKVRSSIKTQNEQKLLCI